MFVHCHADDKSKEESRGYGIVWSNQKFSLPILQEIYGKK